MTPLPPEPVKLIAAILWADEPTLFGSLERMVRVWGAMDHDGPDHPFDLTDYYEAEMGKDLWRRIVSFRKLIAPEGLVEAKLAASGIEDASRESGRRRFNVDVGYLEAQKVVLGSGKSGWQKIYLGNGVYADLALSYSKGKFHPFEWSFADFRSGRYEKDFLKIRERYKAQLKASG